MSGSVYTTLLKSPTQAADIFTQKWGYPKQRHAFLVRFNLNGSGSSANTLTYAVKSVDRPTATPHFEELNQYNRKRIIYTGYKTQPLKIQFYDTADCSAQNMWSAYTTYYFGDFSQNVNAFNGNDIVTNSLNDPNWNYGFTAANGGTDDGDSQYFFKSIEILHFYSQTFESYVLVNPRISSFEPDDLDYEQGGISMINAQFVYEALLIQPATQQNAADQPEFQGLFNGRTVEVAGYADESNPGQTFAPNPQATSDGVVQQLFGGYLQGGVIPVGNSPYGSMLGGGNNGLSSLVFSVMGGSKQAQYGTNSSLFSSGYNGPGVVDNGSWNVSS